MNKGLLLHVITLIVYCFVVMYIFQEETTTKGDRAIIVWFGMVIQIMPAMISVAGDFYEQKVKLK